MKKSYQVIIAACLLTAGGLAFATQQSDDVKDLHHHPEHGMMMMHGDGPMPPVYQSSMQTDNPADALKKLTGDVPALEKGKRYDVHIEVRELPPLPAAPAVPPAPAKDAQPAG